MCLLTVKVFKSSHLLVFVKTYRRRAAAHWLSMLLRPIQPELPGHVVQRDLGGRAQNKQNPFHRQPQPHIGSCGPSDCKTSTGLLKCVTSLLGALKKACKHILTLVSLQDK